MRLFSEKKAQDFAYKRYSKAYSKTTWLRGAYWQSEQDQPVVDTLEAENAKLKEALKDILLDYTVTCDFIEHEARHGAWRWEGYTEKIRPRIEAAREALKGGGGR